MDTIYLRPGRERPIQRKHPWLFSGAIKSVEGSPDPGTTIDIVSAGGDWLARGAYSPNSQIRARVWTWEKEEQVDRLFFERRIQEALALRETLNRNQEVTAYREIHAESDLLPGLIVDRYGPFRIVQFLSQGVEAHRDTILGILAAGEGIEGVYERSDAEARRLEGLASRAGLLSGNEPPECIEIVENGLKFLVDVRKGHKTGFYLDQRVNRRRVRSWAEGDVLDAFCYSGAFTISALSAGVRSTVSVDSSKQSLSLVNQHIHLNGFSPKQVELIEDDVFSFLRKCRDSRRQFDTIILDPPKFAATTSQVDKAARGYKDINLLAFKLLRPGGTLITFSCSGGVSTALFEKIIADAALDAGVEASSLMRLAQADDHPVRLHFPEGRYLKGLVCKVRP